MREAAWINGKRRLTGRWEYHWASDRFEIILNSRDRITGESRRVVVGGDTPEWGNWKLERAASADRNPEGQDPEGLGAEHESAVPAGEQADAQNQPVPVRKPTNA